MLVLTDRTGGLPEPLGMPLHLRRGVVEGRGTTPSDVKPFLRVRSSRPHGLHCWVIDENTDKDTDNMASESRNGENDSVEVFETWWLRGPATSIFYTAPPVPPAIA
jgi:hypothetical protein